MSDCNMASETLINSVKNTPVEAFFLGSGKKNILVMACMHGDEKLGKDVAERLLEYYSLNCLSLPDKRLIFIPLVNPDGYALDTRTNANGVDLNRNFPTKNWEPSVNRDDYYAGSYAASEPETRMLVNLIEEVSFDFILTLHQPYKVINYDGPAQNLSELLSKHNGYDVTTDIGYPTPGSFGTYAGIERNIPTITLELPENEDIEKVWEDNKTGLIEVINFI